MFEKCREKNWKDSHQIENRGSFWRGRRKPLLRLELEIKGAFSLICKVFIFLHGKCIPILLVYLKINFKITQQKPLTESRCSVFSPVCLLTQWDSGALQFHFLIHSNFNPSRRPEGLSESLNKYLKKTFSDKVSRSLTSGLKSPLVDPRSHSLPWRPPEGLHSVLSTPCPHPEDTALPLAFWWTLNSLGSSTLLPPSWPQSSWLGKQRDACLHCLPKERLGSPLVTKKPSAVKKIFISGCLCWGLGGWERFHSPLWTLFPVWINFLYRLLFKLKNYSSFK